MEKEKERKKRAPIAIYQPPNRRGSGVGVDLSADSSHLGEKSTATVSVDNVAGGSMNKSAKKSEVRGNKPKNLAAERQKSTEPSVKPEVKEAEVVKPVEKIISEIAEVPIHPDPIPQVSTHPVKDIHPVKAGGDGKQQSRRTAEEKYQPNKGKRRESDRPAPNPNVGPRLQGKIPAKGDGKKVPENISHPGNSSRNSRFEHENVESRQYRQRQNEPAGRDEPHQQQRHDRRAVQIRSSSSASNDVRMDHPQYADRIQRRQDQLAHSAVDFQAKPKNIPNRQQHERMGPAKEQFQLAHSATDDFQQKPKNIPNRQQHERFGPAKEQFRHERRTIATVAAPRDIHVEEELNLETPKVVESKTKVIPVPGKDDWKKDYQEYKQKFEPPKSSSDDVRLIQSQRSQEVVGKRPSQDENSQKNSGQSYGRPRSRLTLQTEPPKGEFSNATAYKKTALTPVSPIDDWGAEVERSEKLEKSERAISPPPDPFSTHPPGRQRGVLVLPPRQMSPPAQDPNFRRDWPQSESDKDYFNPKEVRRRGMPQLGGAESYGAPMGAEPYHYGDRGHMEKNRRPTKTPEYRIAQLKEALAVQESRMDQMFEAAMMQRPPDLEVVCRVRREIQGLYEELLSIKETHQSGLESAFWKTAFYEAVEIFRLELKSRADEDPRHIAVKNLLLEIIQEGTDVYTRMMNLYEATHNISLVDFCHPVDDTLTKFVERSVDIGMARRHKAVLIACQHFLLDLGDLARYRELELKTQNYGRSRAFYLRAAQLQPSNGRPFCLLGLLALYTHRRLDSIYFLTRSLCAKTPFETASTSLLGAFQEVDRRYALLEDAARCELYQLQNRFKGDNDNSEDLRRSRREIWIRVDGTIETGRPEESVSTSMLDILTGAKTDQLHRRFVSYFLRLAGMIYCKIGMEQFEELAEKILVQLRELLGRTQSPLTSLELVQVVTISLFCIFHAIRKTNVTEKNASSQLQESAVRFSLALFGLLLERLNKVISSGCDVSMTGPDGLLHLVLPALRVFSNWLMLCPNEYKDVICVPFETENFTVDTWGQLATVANFIVNCHLKAPKAVEKPDDVYYVLPEDLMLRSFLSEFSRPTAYELAGAPPDVSAQFARLTSLTELGDYLDGTKFSFFYHNSGLYRARGQTVERSTKTSNRRVIKKSESDYGEASNRFGSPITDSFGNLSLEARKRGEQQKQEYLAREAEKDCRVLLEICPKVLIPDTNTFIDHLPLIQRILDSGLYTVMIPCIVLVELEGLTRRRDSEWVPVQAAKTLSYLSTCSANGDKKLKFVTTKGSEVDDIKFANEQQTERMTADDGILKCCLSKIPVQDGPNSNIRDLKSEPLKLQRSCVLLTDDRNLRVKAIMQEVPVKTVPSFMAWAKL